MPTLLGRAQSPHRREGERFTAAEVMQSLCQLGPHRVDQGQEGGVGQVALGGGQGGVLGSLQVDDKGVEGGHGGKRWECEVGRRSSKGTDRRAHGFAKCQRFHWYKMAFDGKIVL